jgi:hypothetical protein
VTQRGNGLSLWRNYGDVIPIASIGGSDITPEWPGYPTSRIYGDSIAGLRITPVSFPANDNLIGGGALVKSLTPNGRLGLWRNYDNDNLIQEIVLR